MTTALEAQVADLQAQLAVSESSWTDRLRHLQREHETDVSQRVAENRDRAEQLEKDHAEQLDIVHMQQARLAVLEQEVRSAQEASAQLRHEHAEAVQTLRTTSEEEVARLTQARNAAEQQIEQRGAEVMRLTQALNAASQANANAHANEHANAKAMSTSMQVQVEQLLAENQSLRVTVDQLRAAAHTAPLLGGPSQSHRATARVGSGGSRKRGEGGVGTSGGDRDDVEGGLLPGGGGGGVGRPLSGTLRRVPCVPRFVLEGVDAVDKQAMSSLGRPHIRLAVMAYQVTIHLTLAVLLL